MENAAQKKRVEIAGKENATEDPRATRLLPQLIKLLATPLGIALCYSSTQYRNTTRHTDEIKAI